MRLSRLLAQPLSPPRTISLREIALDLRGQHEAEDAEHWPPAGKDKLMADNRSLQDFLRCIAAGGAVEPEPG